MTSLLKIQEPSTPEPPQRPSLVAFLELGFRPLYLCGALWAMVAVSLWVFAPSLLQGVVAGVFWHAHEMFWGFIAAITVGFLLTATSNWTGMNPLQGPALGALVLLWATARLGFIWPGAIAFAVASTADLLFIAMAALAIGRCLLARQSRHNYLLVLLLLGMGSANAAYLYACWRQLDYSVVMHYFFTGMLCMAAIALLIARRVIPFFATRALPQLTVSRHTRSGQSQAGLAACGILVWQFGPGPWAAPLFAAAGLLTLWHVMAWKPWAVLRTPLLWILYLGYAGLGLGLWAAAAYALGWTARMSWPVHLLGMAGFGALIVGMITRTALGHTGRALVADRSMVCSYGLVFCAVVLRLVALGASTHPVPWLHASAACWVLAFAVYLWRFLPMLVRPRADQRPGKPVPLQRRPH